MNYLRKSLYLLLAFLYYSCNRPPIRNEPDWLAALDSLYVWEVQSEINGAIMFLDVAYQKSDSSVTDFLTMSVAKHKCYSRPDWIAVIFPDNINHQEGVFLFFEEAKQSAPNPKEEKFSLRINFVERRDDTYVIRFKDGLAMLGNEKQVDILQKLIESERVYFMVFYPGGHHKTIAVPLKFFREQYKSLMKD